MAERGSGPDPLDGLRAMAEVQRAGLKAAASVVERMLELGRLGSRGPFPFPLPADPSAGSNGSGPERDEDPRRDLRRLRGDAERMLELWGEWMKLLLDAAADSAELTLERPGLAPEGLTLGPAAGGERVRGSVWLHVLDGPPAAPARLFAGALTANDGSVIAGDAISFEPPILDTFALRTSQEIGVELSLPADVAPGIYLGHVLATGLAELALPLRVEVSE